MKFLCVLLVSIELISAEVYNFEPILRQENVLAADGRYKFGFDSESQNVQQLRNSDGIVRGSYSYLDNNGEVQYMEYIAGPDGYNVYRANLPVTAASVTETPEVKAARKAHEEAYNNLKSVTSTQNRESLRLGHTFQNTNYKNEFFTSTVPPYYDEVDSATTVSPLIQNYPLKNHYQAIEVIKKPVASTDTFGASHTPSIHPTDNVYQYKYIDTPQPSSPHSSIKYYKSSETPTVNPVQTQAHKVNPEEHLHALKKAIAAQLMSYTNAPSEVAPVHVSNELTNPSPSRTVGYSPVKVQHYSNSLVEQNQTEVEKNRKLAIIAATRALMKILNQKK